MNCGQTGDERAFYPCHPEVERIHHWMDYYSGFLFQVHGPRDNKEKIKSRALTDLAYTAGTVCATSASAAAMIVAGPAALATGPPIIVFTPANAFVLVSSMTSGSHSLAKESRAASLSIPLQGKDNPTKEEVKEILELLGSNITLTGVCRKCGLNAANTKGCQYVWTCSYQFLKCQDFRDPDFDHVLYGGCKKGCCNCSRSVELGYTVRCVRCQFRMMTRSSNFVVAVV